MHHLLEKYTGGTKMRTHCRCCAKEKKYYLNNEPMCPACDTLYLDLEIERDEAESRDNPDLNVTQTDLMFRAPRR